jgi:hypothetical protein
MKLTHKPVDFKLLCYDARAHVLNVYSAFLNHFLNGS